MRGYQLAAIALAPVLLGQAFFVRRYVRVLPEAVGPRQGQQGQGPRLRILLLGDSSAAGVGAPTQDAALLGQIVARLAKDFTVEYCLIAQSGARTADALAWLAEHDGQYDLVITALGVNDVTKGTSQRTYIAGQRALWRRLAEQHSARRILVSGVPPIGSFPALPQPLRGVIGARASVFARALARAAESEDQVRLVPFDGKLNPHDMATDGFHPGPVIYSAWADRLVAQVIADKGFA